MATLAEYEFPDRSSLNAALSKIYKEVGRQGVEQYGDVIEISSSCDDPQEAGKICRAYGGDPK